MLENPLRHRRAEEETERQQREGKRSDQAACTRAQVYPDAHSGRHRERFRLLIMNRGCIFASMSNYYGVRPFSGKNFVRNSERVRGDQQPCAICGKPVKEPKTAAWAVIVDGGSAWGNDTSDPSHPGYMGGYPVGADCHRKFVVK